MGCKLRSADCVSAGLKPSYEYRERELPPTVTSRLPELGGFSIWVNSIRAFCQIRAKTGKRFRGIIPKNKNPTSESEAGLLIFPSTASSKKTERLPQKGCENRLV
jgi:hypothetical protein